MDGIKNLIFDFGGVIINIARSRCVEAFEQLGVADVGEKISNSYKSKNLFKLLEAGLISAEEFRDDVRLLTQQQLDDKQIDSAWIKMLDGVAPYKLDLLLELRKRYNTMLLSNTNVIHWEWAEKNCFSYKGYQASNFFNKIYLSYELHLQKPDPEIYKYVLQDAAIVPEETLFIDDTTLNCRAAEAFGIHTYIPDPHEDWSHLFK